MASNPSSISGSLQGIPLSPASASLPTRTPALSAASDGSAVSFSRGGLLAALTLASVYLLPMGADALLGAWMLVALSRWPGHRAHLQRIARDPLFGCALALLVYLGVSVFWSDASSWRQHGQVWLRISFVVVFVTTLSATVHETRTLRRLCWWVAGASAAGAAASLVWFAIDGGEHGRLNGIFRYHNPGRAGRLLAAALPFMALLWILEPGARRWLALPAALLAGAAIIASDTRAAWLGGGIGLFVLLLAHTRQAPVRHLLYLSGAVALLAAVLLGIIRFAPTVDWLLPRGDSFRLDIWSAHLHDILQQSGWFGWGQATDHEVAVGDHLFRGAHNMYLAVWGQIGLPGMVLFLAVLGWTGVRLLRRLDRPEARLAWSLLAIGATVFVFSGDRIVDKVNLVWFVVWLPLAVALMLKAGYATAED